MKIVTARRIGLRFRNIFGQLGREHYVTGHHTAGPKDKSYSDCVRLIRQYHAYHGQQGWGGIGYHFCISRRGTIFGLRPTYLKGAHVGGHNSGNIGIMFHGTTGDKPTAAQAIAYRWLLKNAHTSKMPSAHRTDVSLIHLPRYGHNDWSGHQSNGCPGTHKRLIKSLYRGN